MMELDIISCPDRRALENEFTDLMKGAAASSRGVISIVPDQSSFSEEEKLISIFKVTGLGNPEVLSFKRLFFRLREKFPDRRRRLTAAAREMAVMYALESIKEEDFRLFRGVIKKSRLSSTVSGIITGFKRYGVDEAALKNAEEALPASPLKNKIHDCRLALESYNSLMKSSGLSDADDDMTELLYMLNLKECDYFDGKTVFIRHFSDLNKLQRQCVGQICVRAKRVYVGVVWEDKAEFATTGALISGLRRTAEEMGIPFSHRAIQGFTDSRPKPLAYAVRNFYDSSALPFKESPRNSLYLHISASPYTEIQHIAATIARLVSRGERYRNITVAARNAQDYAGYVKRIFPIYGIPVFFDGKRPLSLHSASRLLISAMELAVYGFSHENVFSFAKNPFAPHGGNCGALEDYCLEAGVRSWNWSEDFTFIRGAYSPKEYGHEKGAEELEEINSRRRELYELIAPLAEGLKKPRTGAEYARMLYDFISSAQLPEKIEAAARRQEENGDDRGAGETRQVYNLLMDILEDIYTDFGESALSGEEFLEAFKTACSAVQIGVVPAAADSVIFGDIERMKGSEDKIVFLPGLNEDIFPRAFQNDSVFTEYEAEILAEKYAIELPPMGGEKAENERLLVYEALSSPKEALYMSCPIGKADGSNLRPSSIVRRMRELFPLMRETEDVNSRGGEYLCASMPAAYLELGTAVSRGEGGKFWSMIKSLLNSNEEYARKLELLDNSRGYRAEKTEKLDEELLRKALGDELALSPSKLESFASCPFSFFLQNVLKLRDTEAMSINPADSGSLMHNIIDGFCALASAEPEGMKGISQARKNELFKRVCAEVRGGINLQVMNNPRFSSAVERIERMAEKCVDEILTQLQDELFVPTGSEVIIGEGGRLPASEIVLPDGKKARFSGRIDRADVRTGVKITENGQEKLVDLVRITDYKSSGKKIDFNKVLHGLQLQLFAYMDSYVKAEKDARPAAVLYFNLTETPTPAEIGSDESEKKDRLSGVMVSGRMAEKKGVAEIQADEMDAVLKYVRRYVAKTAEKIYSGEMPVSPAETDSVLQCGYCPYARVCKAGEISPDCVRYIAADKDNAALEEIKKEAAKDEA